MGEGAGLLTRGSFSGGAFPGFPSGVVPPSSPLTVAGPCRNFTDFPTSRKCEVIPFAPRVRADVRDRGSIREPPRNEKRGIVTSDPPPVGHSEDDARR
jgi:hypothetical protein